jgi:hypothetical protein
MKQRPDVNDTLQAEGPDAVRDRLDRATKYNGPSGGQGADGDRASKPKRSIIPPQQAATLMTIEFPPIKFVVPGIIVQGVTLLAGKPKIGKSWLLLHAAIAVARGGFTLGELHCIEGDVLYCALEDGPARVKRRLQRLLGDAPCPERLFYYTKMPRLTEGGLDWLRAWIRSAPNPRLICIDTLVRVKSPKKRDEGSYEADYGSLQELCALASEFNVAIVVVHHLRKADADDPFDTISGTLGLTASPDSLLVLKRDSGGFVLHGHGRDLPDIEKAVSFDRETHVWRIVGEAAAVRWSTERTTVFEAIKEAKEPVGPNDVAAVTGLRPVSVRKLLVKLLKEGAIERVKYGRYQCASVTVSA